MPELTAVPASACGARQSALLHLADRVAQLRQELAVAHTQLGQLVDLESVRPLTVHEEAMVRQLHVDSARIRDRLRDVRREFDHLTGFHRSGA